jgi:hypothetical protein
VNFALKGARSRIPSRDRFVFVDEPAKHVAAAQTDAGPLTSRIVMWLWSFEAEPAMRSRSVVMDGVAAKDTLEVSSPPDQSPV